MMQKAIQITDGERRRRRRFWLCFWLNRIVVQKRGLFHQWIGAIGCKARGECIKKASDCWLSWYYRDSNLGHTDFQSVALPTEL